MIIFLILSLSHIFLLVSLILLVQYVSGIEEKINKLTLTEKNNSVKLESEKDVENKKNSK